ncbi:hypothetical protein [Nocardioides sp. cx-173]|uniref:hypothetical protein n=1 Tax=Nocardioides sp. cx-173 TaxID=2898796 RepID=UPI001E2C102E|nr:hypothetical protein [Nocardioides sp. cx-173]MCD4525043.1 hypothetical protein [Nocardioides sp. cx-173]UGB40249.1 hypothetical protein LQ940_12720 [Nocardioides sp. cx-173]
MTGLESGECSARIEVRQAPGGCLTIDYEATSEREGLQHREHTVVAPDGLFVAFSESPGVSVFEMSADGIFVCTTPGSYAMEIHASFNDGVLNWAWHWAVDGVQPSEMSRAICRAAAY